MTPNYFKNIIENIEKYDIVLLLYEGEKDKNLKDVIVDYKKDRPVSDNIAIIVGPEGGFDVSEIEILKKYPNVRCVTLGRRILRTETAGIATLSMLIYEFEF